MTAKYLKHPNLFVIITLAVTLWTAPAHAATLFIPNASFETPDVSFAAPDMDAWQKSPPPLWYPTNSPFPWEQLMGQFANTPVGSSNYIENMDGNQAAFLFASPDVAIIQDFNTISVSNDTPTHLFNAQYEAGKTYALTVAVLGGGGGMLPGVTFEISLYYRDASNSIVTVGATTITNSPELFPTNTYFTDFQVKLPPVLPGDAWAGKRIGIRLASTAGFENQGGYWDIDNIRLTSSIVPNYSFEAPTNNFADPAMDAWQKAPAPDWSTNLPPPFIWEQVIGEFQNTPYGASNHISNMEGSQGAFMFALPDAYIFQDYNSLSGTNTAPAHDFNATFEVGKSYALTVGVLGNGGGMLPGVLFELSLYYRDASGNIVTVASTLITNSAELFPAPTCFTDFQTVVPLVKSGDAWAGKKIGIKLASLADFFNQGGYWDLDNVRLVESIVPNNSFEMPANTFASPEMDAWQKSPQPFWYTNTGPFAWENLMGQFVNTTNGAPDHIGNLDGRQAAFLFALPEVALFQDYTTVFGTNTAPTHDFTATYETGRSYNLTVGVLGNNGGMARGATLQLSLYYRDSSSNMVTVASTTITNSADLFPTNTHLIDFAVVVPAVRGNEPWAGRHIGIQIASSISLFEPALAGGYWDVDNVRLQTVRDPFLKNSGVSGGQFTFTLDSAPGRLEILTSTNVTLPTFAWTTLGAVTNSAGTLPVTDPNTISGQRFYKARQIP